VSQTDPTPTELADADRAFMNWWHRAGIGTRENPKLAWHAAVEWAGRRERERVADSVRIGDYARLAGLFGVEYALNTLANDIAAGLPVGTEGK